MRRTLRGVQHNGGMNAHDESPPIVDRRLEARLHDDRGRGRLVLAATPIGDSRDGSPALQHALSAADVIAAEDTRRLVTLLRRLNITAHGRIESFFEGNETERIPHLVAALEAGDSVLVATDAGMPSVSDPGYRLVRATIEAGLEVTVVPGPSAVPTALAISGLACDRFCFEGFLPRKQQARRTRLADLAAEPRTMVFFEAPHRLDGFLADAAATFGDDRQGVVCRELTKPHEEVIRGSLAELAGWAVGEVRGEITVVVAGASRTVPSLDDGCRLVRARIHDGEKLSAAVSAVAAELGLVKKDLYAAALADRDRRSGEKSAL